MGESAEEHINGVVCELCGTFLDGAEPGYPRYCSKGCCKAAGGDPAQVVTDFSDKTRRKNGWEKGQL